ncbi:glycosyltransferase family 9 protein [Paracrocinitomix mangrovi]|uniref:glycosyltransferase family 9 protein n=1 Tax=Paracrocinitomix mangrovi TaxID=2862509 RepID=UPI001C8E6191|nr:glycosyltransferase family 9 protein [Paracrocinitomix mangrovi]UKN00671.1 glycosyltransferase family 9 protein [Paracrocinitomix mangrovi]
MATKQLQKIVISRTDSIGDVVLTLPLAGILKKKYPEATIVMLIKSYTRSIVACSEYVDEIWEWDVIERWSYNDQIKWLVAHNVDCFIHVFPRKELARLAKKAEVPIRIGTSHRSYHILTCNKRVNFTRKRSDLHEAQLNTKLLEPLGIKKEYSLKELASFLGFTKIPDLPKHFKDLLNLDKQKVIFHPKSQGSAREWPLEQYMSLATQLDADKFQIFFTGTKNESEEFSHLIPKQDNIVDLSGQMSLEELVAFISHVDHLVAASTGPLHISAACGVHAIGLYTDMRPIHPGRWQPIGNEVTIIVSEKNNKPTQPLEIDIRVVEKALNAGFKK